MRDRINISDMKGGFILVTQQIMDYQSQVHLAKTEISCTRRFANRGLHIQIIVMCLINQVKKSGLG